MQKKTFSRMLIRPLWQPRSDVGMGLREADLQKEQNLGVLRQCFFLAPNPPPSPSPMPSQICSFCKSAERELSISSDINCLVGLEVMGSPPKI